MSFIQEIENIEDHRVDANKDYELADITFLTIAAVLYGAKGWKAITFMMVMVIMGGSVREPIEYCPSLTGLIKLNLLKIAVR